MFKDPNIDRLLWMLIGVIVAESLKYVFLMLKKYYVRLRYLKNISKEDIIAFNDLKIISLDHADPVYDLADITTSLTDYALYVDCPLDIKSAIKEIDSTFEFNNRISFCKTNDFKDLIDMTGIKDIEELLEKHRVIIAKSFLERLRNGLTVFNHDKYGIHNIRRLRLGKEENAGVKFDLFKTDYFTHRVFRSIYKELRERNHEISNIRKYEELPRYSPFCTSLGINAFLLLSPKGYSEDKIVFAKRSKYIDNTGNDSLWHVTMNEGLSVTDLEGNDVSIIKCLHRGLREEIGIREEHHNKIVNEKFMDIFLEMQHFEIGLTAIVKMEMSFDELLMYYSIAKDSVLETDLLVAISVKECHKFIQENKLTNAGLYTLKMFESRRRYF